MRMVPTTEITCSVCSQAYELGAKSRKGEGLVPWLVVRGHGSTLSQALDQAVCRSCATEEGLPSLWSVLKKIGYKSGDELIRTRETISARGKVHKAHQREIVEEKRPDEKPRKITLGDLIHGPKKEALEDVVVEIVDVPSSVCAYIKSHEWRRSYRVEVVRSYKSTSKLPKPNKRIQKVATDSSSSSSHQAKIKILYPKGNEYGDSPFVMMQNDEYSYELEIFSKREGNRVVSLMNKGMYAQMQRVEDVWHYFPMVGTKRVDDAFIGSVQKGLEFPSASIDKQFILQKIKEQNQVFVISLQGDAVLMGFMFLDYGLVIAMDLPSELESSDSSVIPVLARQAQA